MLVVSLNSTLESFSFRNGSSVDLVASFKNVSFDLLCKCIISCVLEFELFYESLSSYSSFCEMSLLSLGYTMTMNDFLFTIFVFVTLFFTFSFSTHRTWRFHLLVHYQTNLSEQYGCHPSPYKRCCHRLKDEQASGCCSQALGKFLLTFPVCSTFHCMTVSTNRYHQHLM